MAQLQLQCEDLIFNYSAFLQNLQEESELWEAAKVAWVLI